VTTPSEEYRRFRHEMRDTNDPPLFCDDFIKFAYDEAERQAAKIGKLLFDRNSHVCNIPLLGDKNSYRLDESVLEVARVTVFDGVTRWTAKVRDLYEYDMLQPDWRSMDFSATKSVFVYDSTIEIAGNCDFDGTLNIECYRLPLQNASDADQFEISAQHHPHLIDWAKYLAYQTRDADTEQAEYAKIHEERFRAYFSGVAVSAEAARGKQRKPDAPARSGRGATPAQLADAFFAECGDLNYKNTDGRQLDAGWARSLIEDYINEAEYEACERINIIFDSSSSICSISTNPATKSYLIDSKVVGIKSISFTDAALDNYDISYREKHEFAKVNPSFKSLPFTENKSVFIDNYTLEIAGVPVAGTLHLEIYRTPLANASVSGQFEIPDKYHASLLDWVKYRSFSNPDTDAYDEAKAVVFLAKFEESFGKKRELWISESIKTSLPVLASAGSTLTPSYLFNLFIHECGGYSFKNSDGFVYDAGWVRNLILGYIDEAEKEACERMNIIFDANSPICSINTASTTKSYSINSNIIFIKSISFTDAALNNYEINYREKHEFAKVSPLFNSQSFLDNKSVFIDNYTLEIAGVPVAGTLQLEVYRTPLVNASVADQFSVPEKYHAKLLDWVKYRAFANPDIDIYNDLKSTASLVRFEDNFGKKRGLSVSESIKTSLPVLASAGAVLTPSYLFNLFIHECGGYSFKNTDGFVYDAGWVRNLILGYVDEAEKEACERADLIYDTSTSSVCNISVNTSSAIYSIDESVYFIKAIKFTDSLGNSFDVLVRNKNEFLKINSGYRSEAFSASKSVFIENRTIEIAGIPDVAGVLHLEVYRTPLTNASIADQFEIPERRVSSLINWVKYRAFSNPDIDIYDEAKAAVFLARFEDSFGRRQVRGIVSDEIKKSLPAIQSRSQRAITPSAAINLFIHECGGISFKNSDGFLKDAGWAESVLTGYLDEAEYEACERSNILFDKDTPAVCQIPVVVGRSVYPLHGSITGISYIKFAPAVGDQFDALVREKVEFGQISPAWRTAGFSANRCVFVHDSEIEIAGIPDIGGTLHLEVYRTPLANASISGQFEVPEKYHAKLLDWVKYRAFANPDIDIYDVKKSYVFYGQFQKTFGKGRDRKYIADEIKTSLPVSANTSGALSPLDLCNLFRLDAREKAFKNADGTLYDAGWRTDLLLSYADEAEREAAARASLIFDSETESICKMSITSGQSRYQLSELIVRVCKCSFVKSDGSVYDLEVRYSESEDVVNKGNRTKDFLENRVVYIREGELSCQGNVSVAGDILLEVYRYPKVSASSIGSFEISSRHHVNLLNYIKYKAYSSVDNDVFHESALYHERKFIDIYGSKKTESLVNRESIRYLRTNKRWY
jgi:hypothetical protein